MGTAARLVLFLAAAFAAQAIMFDGAEKDGGKDDNTKQKGKRVTKGGSAAKDEQNEGLAEKIQLGKELQAQRARFATQRKAFTENQKGQHDRETGAWIQNYHEEKAKYDEYMRKEAAMKKELEATKYERQVAELKWRIEEHQRLEKELAAIREQQEIMSYQETDAQKKMRMRDRNVQHDKKEAEEIVEQLSEKLNETGNLTWDDELAAIEAYEETAAKEAASDSDVETKDEAADVEANAAAEAPAEHQDGEAHALGQTERHTMDKKALKEWREEQWDKWAAEQKSRAQTTAEKELHDAQQHVKAVEAKEAQGSVDLVKAKEERLKQLKVDALQWHKDAQEDAKEQLKLGATSREERAAAVATEEAAIAREVERRETREVQELRQKAENQAKAERAAAEAKKAAEEARLEKERAAEEARLKQREEIEREATERAAQEKMARAAARKAQEEAAEAAEKAKEEAIERRAREERERVEAAAAAEKAAIEQAEQDRILGEKLAREALSARKRAAEWLVSEQSGAPEGSPARFVLSALGEDADMQQVGNTLHAYAKAMRNNGYMSSMSIARNLLHNNLTAVVTRVKNGAASLARISTSMTDAQVLGIAGDYAKQLVALLRQHQSAAANFSNFAAKGMPELSPFLSSVTSHLVPFGGEQDAVALASANVDSACPMLKSFLETYGKFDKNITKASRIMNATARVMKNLTTALPVLSPPATQFAMRMGYIEAMALQEATAEVLSQVGHLATERFQCDLESAAGPRFGMSFVGVALALFVGARATLL